MTRQWIPIHELPPLNVKISVLTDRGYVYTAIYDKEDFYNEKGHVMWDVIFWKELNN